MFRCLLILTSLTSVFAAACGDSHTRCDQIKVGEATADLKKDSDVTCVTGNEYGDNLAGTCNGTDTWTCVEAAKADDYYAHDCYGDYLCLVQSDANGKVVCVKHFCMD